MSTPNPLHPFLKQLASLSREYGVRELSTFGPVLRTDFSEASDVDLLVEFLPEVKVSMFPLLRMRQTLEALLGRTVDLVPKDGLEPTIREQVLAGVQYASGGPMVSA